MGACSIDGGGCPCNRKEPDVSKLQEYLCHYMHNGQVHSATVDAYSIEDAQARLRSMVTGVVDCALGERDDT